MIYREVIVSHAVNDGSPEPPAPAGDE